MVDAYYTPASVARTIAEMAPDAPLSVCDPHCGDGALLSAFAERHPSTIVIGADRNRSAVAALRRKYPTWLLYCMDSLAARTPARVRGLRQAVGDVDLLLLNPPFSMGASKGVSILRRGQQIRASVAWAHLLTALDLYGPRRAIAIVPDSALHASRDARSRELADEWYTCDPYERLSARVFPGAVATSWIVQLTRRAAATSPVRAVATHRAPEPAPRWSVVRGTLPVHSAEVGLLPFVHTVDLLPIQQGVRGWVRQAVRVAPRGSGQVVGHTILLPRVGRVHHRFAPTATFFARPVQISDCVIGIELETQKQAAQMQSILRGAWTRFCNDVYHGTGAPYARVDDVRAWLVENVSRADTS